jgi:[protein-PII] uridylyltransferase
MRQLYNETKKVLRHGVEVTVDKSDYIAETQAHAIARLSEYDLEEDQILQIWGDVDEEYFLRESVSNIVWHTLAIKDHDLDQGPLILIGDMASKRENEGATQIFVYTRRRDYIFASIVTAFDLLSLTVVDARIARSKTLAFDTFMVLEGNGKSVGPFKNRIDKIRALLIKHLSQDEASKPKAIDRTPRLLKPFAFKTEVQTSLDNVNQLTIIDVHTPDRPGLLSIVANIFVDLEIHVHNAKITTLGERVEDVFYVTGTGGLPLADTTAVSRRICEELDQHIQRESA